MFYLKLLGLFKKQEDNNNEDRCQVIKCVSDILSVNKNVNLIDILYVPAIGNGWGLASLSSVRTHLRLSIFIKDFLACACVIDLIFGLKLYQDELYGV